MHRPRYGNQLLTQLLGRAASRRKSRLLLDQAQAWKSAADTAPGPRGEQEEKPPPA